MKNLKRFPVVSSLKSIHSSDLKQNKVTVSLTLEETHHLKGVLHVPEGTKCVLFDSEGNECIGQVEPFRVNAPAEVRLLERVAKNSESHLKLSVAQAIPQDRKMDEIVRKSAELGIYELIPLTTERTIVRMKKEQVQKVTERWQRVLTQAAKQSQVSKLPQIKSLTSFEPLLSQFGEYDRVFMLHPSKESKPIRETAFKTEKVLLMIGPEGGFSDREAKEARLKGAELIAMGPEIMRTDTAFVAAAGFFKLMGEQ